MGKQVTAAGPGNTRQNARIALVIASLVLMLAGGLFAYFFAAQEEERAASSVRGSAGQASSSLDICQENMIAVLHAQQEFFELHGSYASDPKEHLDLPAKLEFCCPMSGEAYEMSIQGDNITLYCESHDRTLSR